MKTIKITTALLGALGIVLGAFAAHGLKATLSAEQLDSFQTGVRYQLIHVLFILWLISSDLSLKTKKTITTVTLIGIVFFSGSIYLLSTGIVPASSIWFITPLGGLLFMVSWILLAWSFLKEKQHD